MHRNVSIVAMLVAMAMSAGCSRREMPPELPEPPASPAKPAATQASAAAVSVPSGDEKCTNEPRTDQDDKRPRCGGMGTPQAAPSLAYRITLDNGESITACDITKPFSGKIGGGMVTMSFTPADGRSGTVAWHFAGGGGVADTAYDYALSGPGEKMTGSFHANTAICGKAAGLGACATAKKQDFSSTWTRIEACTE